MIDLHAILIYTCYGLEVNQIERELLWEIERVMRERGLTQREYAAHKGSSPQSVNPYFNGRRGLMTDTGVNLLEWLGVRIKLEPIPAAAQPEIHGYSKPDEKFSMENSSDDLEQLEGLVKRLKARASRLGEGIRSANAQKTEDT